MKNIQIYCPEKYSTSAYTKVEDNVYKGKNPYYRDGSGWDEPMYYFASLMFEQEPELGEGETPQDISQYPLEELLEMYSVCVTDFYDELNSESDRICYQEFGSGDLENIRKLLGIVGKHVYEKKVYADDLSEADREACKGMTEEEMEEEGFIWYDTVVE